MPESYSQIGKKHYLLMNNQKTFLLEMNSLPFFNSYEFFLEFLYIRIVVYESKVTNFRRVFVGKFYITLRKFA